jgi:hypothetical protein
MRPLAPLFASFILVSAGVPAIAQTAASLQLEQQEEHHCVALKKGNPRISEGIGITFGPDVPRTIVEQAVEHWSRCHGYQTDFPAFVIGRPGTQTVKVEFDNSYKRQARCGSFVGRTIVLYAFAVDGNGRLRSCGSRVDGLAHELGHLLGLLDAPHDKECFDHAMAPIDVTDRNRRSIQPAECRAAGERWLTTTERAVTEPLLLASASPAGG